MFLKIYPDSVHEKSYFFYSAASKTAICNITVVDSLFVSFACDVT